MWVGAPTLCTAVLPELMSRVLVRPTQLSEPTFPDLERFHELTSHHVGHHGHWSPLQLYVPLVADGVFTGASAA